MSDLRELARLEPHFWRAPSAHNTQPWLLTYASDQVQLRYDPERALPAADPTQRDLLLSLGAFVETVLIVAADAGIALDFAAGVDLPGRRVGAFVPASAPHRAELTREDVARRQTSRLPYAPGRIDPGDLAEARRQILAGGELHEVPTCELADLVEAADHHVYESRDVVAELREWLRLSPRHPRYELDGLSYDCLDLTRAEAWAVAILLRPTVHRVVRTLRLHRGFSRSTVKLLEPDGSALVLTGAADSPELMLTHGRSLCRAWLALGRRGLYTHPLSQVLDCPATERELASRLGATGDRRLLSVFRTGRSEPPARSRRMR